MAERRKRASQAGITEIASVLLALPIRLEAGGPAQALGPVLALGRTHGLTACDAACLELATRRGLPLATLEDRLRAATVAVGAGIYMP